MKHHTLLWFATVAGAVLLTPAIVGAHSATGLCADCHTIHNSQNGEQVNSAGPQAYLLKLSCIGCHARTFNEANGRADSAGGPAAPQVGPSAAPPSGAQISGGYFSIGGTGKDAMTHNVADLILPIPDKGADSLIAGSTAPGGSFPLANGSGGPALQCTSCHDPAIGHSPANSVRTGTSTSSYRMLHGTTGPQYVKGTGDIDFEAGSGQNQYDADSMNKFCANCHGLFHGAAGTGSTGAWIRHPTDVHTNTYGDLYKGTDKVVPVGNIVTSDYFVMCISCHRPHGNGNPDMLRFAYGGSANLAADGIASQGCETCHGSK